MNGADDAPVALVSHGVTWSRVRLARALSRAGIASGASSLVAGGVARAYPTYGSPQLASTVCFLASIALLVASFVVWFRRASWPGDVTLDEEAIHVRRGGTTRSIERSRITSAYSVMRH